jgi:twitching motility protein PilT
MDISVLLRHAQEREASDLHITINAPPVMRINGELSPIGDTLLTVEDTERLVGQLLNAEQRATLDQRGQCDCSFGIRGVGRFRINCYRQRSSYAIVARVISTVVPNLRKLNLPPVVQRLAEEEQGLVLVTGPTGSGKSTTLAAMINHLNCNFRKHILTLEHPIEYIHRHQRSLVNQREIGSDTHSFAEGLRGALRQDPDVILIGEMRDLETIQTALTAAETGHMVFATLHTRTAIGSVERIIDVFPAGQQSQIRTQLASVLTGIISQRLLKRRDGRGRVAALEILVAVPAIRNLIRNEKNHQIESALQTGGSHGMQTMSAALTRLARTGLIDPRLTNPH